MGRLATNGQRSRLLRGFEEGQEPPTIFIFPYLQAMQTSRVEDPVIAFQGEYEGGYQGFYENT